jgi:hypothetical protein
MKGQLKGLQRDGLSLYSGQVYYGSVVVLYTGHLIDNVPRDNVPTCQGKK